MIKEYCIYNRNVLCGGAAERLERCWRCHWNPTVAAEQKKREAAKEESKKAKTVRF